MLSAENCGCFAVNLTPWNGNFYRNFLLCVYAQNLETALPNESELDVASLENCWRYKQAVLEDAAENTVGDEERSQQTERMDRRRVLGKEMRPCESFCTNAANKVLSHLSLSPVICHLKRMNLYEKL